MINEKEFNAEIAENAEERIFDRIQEFSRLQLMDSFDDWLRSYPWLFERDLRCIVSPDLDGLSCALLQQMTLGWEPVGTYDGVTLSLYEKAESINWDTVVFLDVEILREKARSVGNHLFALDDIEVCLRISGCPHCVSPNLWRGITVLDSFSSKYPFSTLPLLIATHTIRDPDFRVGEAWLALILHTDSSLSNAAKYQANALNWLKAMQAKSEASGLRRFCKLLEKIQVQTALRLVDRVHGWAEEARFGKNQRACRFTPGDEKAAAVGRRIAKELGHRYTLPFGNQAVQKFSFTTQKLPIDTKGRKKSSFLTAWDAKIISMAATGQTKEGLSMTLPDKSCPIELFQ